MCIPYTKKIYEPCILAETKHPVDSISHAAQHEHHTTGVAPYQLEPAATSQQHGCNETTTPLVNI